MTDLRTLTKGRKSSSVLQTGTKEETVEKTETRSFPLSTVLVIIKARELGRRGVERTGVMESHGKELMTHMYPGMRVPDPRDMGEYLRNSLAPLLRKQFPELAHVSVAKVTQANFQEWMEVQESEFGAEIEVPVIGKTR